MQIKPFVMERWQSVWENRVELNISESGVLPLTLAELAGSEKELARIAQASLGYPQTNGSEATRAGVARLYLGATTANVLMTTGCAEANFLVVLGLVEPGDEVVVIQPNYMQVPGVARGLGATVRVLWLREDLGWQPDPEELRRAITPNTKLVALCNPNNPTGATLSEKTMSEMTLALEKSGAWLLADEVYRGAERELDTTPSFWGRYERVICTGGMSKSYGLPGLRVGWIVAPEELTEKLWGFHDYTSIAISALSDRLAGMVLEPERHARIILRTRSIIQQHYPIVAEWVARHGSSFAHVPPAAGAIAWVRYKNGPPSDELAETLRAKRSTLIVPGTQFEMEHHLRIGFGYSAEVLQRALARVDEALADGRAHVASSR
jgi:hypothetical protein